VARPRVESIDVLRGVVMVLMALDHVRDYFGNAAVSPTDLRTATAALFVTRWITHFCAPVFFFLTGTGAYLARERRSPANLARFLAARGVWLIGLELIVLRCLGWQFNFDFRLTMLAILWALGWAMITLAALVSLPVWIAVAFGAVMIAGHNLLDPIRAAPLGALAPLWTILHAPNFLWQGDRTVFVAYPLVPWIGVTALGYGFGQVYRWEAQRRQRLLVLAGVCATAAFVALRALNVYGDPSRWRPQRSALFTVLSFLNTTKYPPSLLYILMTLGPALIFLWLVDERTPRPLNAARVLGKVPLFYFALHVVVIHTLAVIVCYARYGAVHWMFESPTVAQYPVTQPPGWPMSLPVVYLVWFLVVAMLYPLCRWFATVKQRSTNAALSYL
jgi:uncharacterized membrane protein